MKFTGALLLGQLKCSHESSEGEEERWNRKICNSSTGHWPGLLYGFLLWMNRKLQLSVETDEATWQFSDNSVTKVLHVTSCCAGNTAGYKWRLVKGAVVTISTSQSRKAVAVLRIGLTILTSMYVIVFTKFRVATSSRHYAKWECKQVNTVSRHKVGMLVTKISRWQKHY